jgi:tetratricopeptide (TPR) repeat protein
VRLLKTDEQDRLRQEVVELLLLLAQGTSEKSASLSKPAERQEQVQLAMSLNSRAESWSEDGRGSQALWKQRAVLADQLGMADEANQAHAKALATPPQTIHDLYLTAYTLEKEHKYREALPLLQLATTQDPQSFPTWLVKGNCHLALDQYLDATACYTAGIALRPKSFLSWYNRGLSYLRQRHWAQARADFDRAIELNPDLEVSYINRAIAFEGLQKYPDAINDLTKAIDLGTPMTRVYFMRSGDRLLAGDREGAIRDREKGLQLEPSDAVSWVARGKARLNSKPPDPQGAIADFDKALELDPDSVDALQNKAYVLSEKLNRGEDALRVLNENVARNPESVPARAGRGVLLARLGLMTAARADAEEARHRDTTPKNLYQVAGIYALTSKQQPDDRILAFESLSKALRGGFGWDYVDIDTDLDPIRNTPEFRRILETARALKENAAQGQKNRPQAPAK